MELDVLPEEILRQILHNLYPVDVLAASRVCHCWNVIAAEPEYWEQHIRRDFPAKLPVDHSSVDLKKVYKEAALSARPARPPWKVSRPKGDEHSVPMTALLEALQTSLQGLNFRQQVFRQREFGCNVTPLHYQMFDESLSDIPCVVKRNGVFVHQSFSVLVPGDIVELRSGTVVPADVRLLPAAASHPWCSLVTDRSPLYPASRRFFHHTAEGAPAVSTLDGDPRVALFGSRVVSGTAQGVVFAVASSSVFCGISSKVVLDSKYKSAATSSRRPAAPVAGAAVPGGSAPSTSATAASQKVSFGKYVPILARVNCFVMSADELLLSDVYQPTHLITDGTSTYYLGDGPAPSDCKSLAELAAAQAAASVRFALAAATVFSQEYISAPLASEPDPTNFTSAQLKPLYSLLGKFGLPVSTTLKTAERRVLYREFDSRTFHPAAAALQLSDASGYAVVLGPLESVAPLCSHRLVAGQPVQLDDLDLAQSCDALRQQGLSVWALAEWRNVPMAAFGSLPPASPSRSSSGPLAHLPSHPPARNMEPFLQTVGRKLTLVALIGRSRLVNPRAAPLLARMKELEVKVVLTGLPSEDFKRLAERTSLPPPQDFSSLKPDSKTAGDPHGAVAILPSGLGTFSKDALRSVIGGFDVLLLGQDAQVEARSETIKALQSINLIVAACSAAAVDGLAMSRAELPLHPPSLCPFIQNLGLQVPDAAGEGFANVLETARNEVGAARCVVQ
jgi:hypothetical protein